MPHTAGYRRLLLARQAELLSELRRGIQEFIAQREGEDDLAISHYDFVSERIANLDYKELKPIAAALIRIERGSYGICRKCGCPIPADRLCAVPWVDRCSACESAVALAGVA